MNTPLPTFVGWGLLLVAGFGILLDVDTGFWLMLIVAINAIVVSQQSIQLPQSNSVPNENID